MPSSPTSLTYPVLQKEPVRVQITLLVPELERRRGLLAPELQMVQVLGLELMERPIKTDKGCENEETSWVT
jgi:hypothetical protein